MSRSYGTICPFGSRQAVLGSKDCPSPQRVVSTANLWRKKKAQSNFRGCNFLKKKKKKRKGAARRRVLRGEIPISQRMVTAAWR